MELPFRVQPGAAAAAGDLRAGLRVAFPLQALLEAPRMQTLDRGRDKG